MTEFRSEAHVATAHAARYLGQLCKHFAHRVPATFEGPQGRIEFAFGICDMQAADGTLVLHATAKDAPSLEQVEDVVARHLERFAFRDRPEVRWSRSAA
jgi:uncharacterized protein